MSEERPGMIFNFFIRALIGMAIIFFVNYFLDSQGIEASVGMNGGSFLTSGILGVPGVALLYGIVFYNIL